MKFGRKGCYIGAMTLNMVSLIWNTYFYGAGEWYGLCILGGFGTAAYEAIIQLTVSISLRPPPLSLILPR